MPVFPINKLQLSDSTLKTPLFQESFKHWYIWLERSVPTSAWIMSNAIQFSFLTNTYIRKVFHHFEKLCYGGWWTKHAAMQIACKLHAQIKSNRKSKYDQWKKYNLKVRKVKLCCEKLLLKHIFNQYFDGYLHILSTGSSPLGMDLLSWWMHRRCFMPGYIIFNCCFL